MATYLSSEEGVFYSNTDMTTKDILNNDISISKEELEKLISKAAMLAIEGERKKNTCAPNPVVDVISPKNFCDTIAQPIPQQECPKPKYKQFPLSDFCSITDKLIAPSAGASVSKFELCGTVFNGCVYLSKFSKKETRLVETENEEKYEVPMNCITGSGIIEDVLSGVNFSELEKGIQSTYKKVLPIIKEETPKIIETVTKNPELLSDFSDGFNALKELDFNELISQQPKKTLSSIPMQTPNVAYDSLNNLDLNSLISGVTSKLNNPVVSSTSPMLFSQQQVSKNCPKQVSKLPTEIATILSEKYKLNSYMNTLINTIPTANNFSKENADAVFVRNYLSGFPVDPNEVRASIITNIDKLDSDSILSQIFINHGYKSNNTINDIVKTFLNINRTVTTKDLFDLINPNIKDSAFSFAKDLSCYISPKQFVDFIKSLESNYAKKRMLSTFEKYEFDQLSQKIFGSDITSPGSNLYTYIGLGIRDIAIGDLDSVF